MQCSLESMLALMSVLILYLQGHGVLMLSLFVILLQSIQQLGPARRKVTEAFVTGLA